jgi:hypothetical protein
MLNKEADSTFYDTEKTWNELEAKGGLAGKFFGTATEINSYRY